MRVLVLGAGGFIGGRVCAGLLARGHDVVPCGRDAAALRRRFPGRLAMAADLARDGARDWLPRLAGLDAVVQAAGALGGPDLEAVHARGPAALFDACAAAGVARLVQVSALGAGPGAPSRFHRTKREADEHLLRLRAAAEATRRRRRARRLVRAAPLPRGRPRRPQHGPLRRARRPAAAAAARPGHLARAAPACRGPRARRGRAAGGPRAGAAPPRPGRAGADDHRRS